MTQAEIIIFQEKEKAREDRKKYLSEYKSLLETCDFIKVLLFPKVVL